MTILQGTMQDGTVIPVQVDAQGRLVAEGLQGAQGPPGAQGLPGADGGSFALPPDPEEGKVLGWSGGALAWVTGGSAGPPITLPVRASGKGYFEPEDPTKDHFFVFDVVPASGITDGFYWGPNMRDASDQTYMFIASGDGNVTPYEFSFDLREFSPITSIRVRVSKYDGNAVGWRIQALTIDKTAASASIQAPSTATWMSLVLTHQPRILRFSDPGGTAWNRLCLFAIEINGQILTGSRWVRTTSSVIPV